MAGAKALTYERHKRLSKPKGPTARYRAKRRRAEAPVAKKVRAECLERDGLCRVCCWEDNPGDWHSDDLEPIDDLLVLNPSQWAHLGDGKRAKTRGMKPEARHSTVKSLMLCEIHHDRYDGRQEPRMFIEPITELGADGPMEFTQ